MGMFKYTKVKRSKVPVRRDASILSICSECGTPKYFTSTAWLRGFSDTFLTRVKVCRCKCAHFTLICADCHDKNGTQHSVYISRIQCCKAKTIERYRRAYTKHNQHGDMIIFGNVKDKYYIDAMYFPNSNYCSLPVIGTENKRIRNVDAIRIHLPSCQSRRD